MSERNMVLVSNMSKSYSSKEGDVHAVKGISFRVGEGEFYTLLGPSGCGKTTTMRCIAGLEKLDGGQVMIGGDVVAEGRMSVPPYRRPIGMVFQSYAIWPHMSVAGNVAFPLKNSKTEGKKYSSKQISSMVEEALCLVQLEGLGDRPAPNLSGGQQQRLALARALVARPSVLLLDEPLSNLDAKLREDMRLELKSLVKRLNITTFYVTHDQLEALALSDRVALMLNGNIVEEGPPLDMYMDPHYNFTAHFIGTNNVWKGELTETRGGVSRIDIGDSVNILSSDDVPDTGKRIEVAVRPEHIEIVEAGTTEREGEYNKLEGVVKEAVFLGDRMDYRVVTRGKEMKVQASALSRIERNAKVTVCFSPEHVSILADVQTKIDVDESELEEVLARE